MEWNVKPETVWEQLSNSLEMVCKCIATADIHDWQPGDLWDSRISGHLSARYPFHNETGRLEQHL